MKKNVYKTNPAKYIFFLISAAIFLMLATRSSFLYVFNNWDDANSYFSMGKALFNGEILYKDVFDQKGPYLYFLYGLAYLIQDTGFLGVFILEILLGFFDILGFFKILKLYINEELAFILSPLSFLVIVISRSFWWGGSAEEMCLPLYIWGLYLILRYLKAEYRLRTMSNAVIIMGGILAGLVANIKFTGLGFFFAWMAIVWISFLVYKDFAGSIGACFLFLLGMFIPFIPWLIYFGMNDALYDWYWGYVYINVFLYPSSGSEELYDKFYSMAKILYWIVRDNYMYFIFVIPGLIHSIFAKEQKILARIAVPILFIFMYLGIFIGGRKLPYYSLPLSVFSVFGFAFAGNVIEILDKKQERKQYLPYIILNLLCVPVIALLSMNVSFMSQKADDYFLFRFRDEVLETKDPTLLNINCLDAGLYTVTGIVPSCRWFQTQTLDIAEDENNPYKEQDRYIKEALTDYVIARDSYPDFITENYDLIDEAEYSYSDYDFTYYLFRKRE